MQFQIPYGKTHLSFHLSDERQVDWIEPPQVPPAPDALGQVRRALESPLGGFDWGDVDQPNSVAIAVNDKTRPVPHDLLLPPLLAQLTGLGISDSAITFFVAVGTHLPMDAGEFAAILPAEILERYRVVSHDSENPEMLTFLGQTSRHTPVWVNQAFFQSTLKIVVGNIEPHQFAGFSGGVKTAAVGLGGLESINRNHALMIHPDSQLGAYETNPVRQDVEEMGDLIGIHLALNAILNQDRQIVHVLAGEPRAVMQAGVPLSRQVCQIGVSERYGLMIVSPGGHPKDINVYQAQKGLAHAAQVIQPGGTIILAAACPEGAGSPHYESWMIGKSSHQEVMDRFHAEGFRVGPHKAYLIVRDASKANLVFCSDMDDSCARALLLNPASDLQAAVDRALQNLPPGDRIGILPHASSTIPYLVE